ncbi:MAG: hypothetical protein Q8N05_14605 [Bacteroidota bacterium]|nr:hypothetical protein [Bacteroidota bacterium]
MTAKELIQELQKLSPDTIVVVRGYEDGYNEISNIRQVKIKHDPNAEWFYGEYADCNSGDAINAVELFGENRNNDVI